jgi:protein TonB
MVQMQGMVLALSYLNTNFMHNKVSKKFGSFCLIAVFCVGGLAACNSDSDTKTAENGMASDSSAKTAGATDSTAKDSAATASKPAKKKRKASIVFAPAGTDKMVKDKDGVYNRAEIMPEYPGGQSALSAYVNDHLDYDQASADTGTLKISFVVDENGKVMDVRLMGDRKIGNGLDEQAVKLISNMPAWTPGKVKGRNVKTRLELPIAFELES